MKKIVVLFSLALLSSSLHAQVKNDTVPGEVLTFVEEDAVFNGNLSAYISSNIKYPRSIAVDGKVVVSFVVERDGVVSNVQIVKGLPECPDCEKEVIRLIYNMPPWKPGKVNGKAVRSRMTLPVKFTT